MDRKIKILIVEDEKIIAADISQNLKGLGYEVVKLVSSGQDAVKKCGELKPDVVLMDIKLQGKMDGVEAADEIRKKYGTPVVYVTSYTDEETLERVKQTEPYGFIVKPIMEEELKGVIETTVYKYRMEQSLKEIEAWQSVTLRSIGDAVITLDKKGRVTFVNRVAENLTGWSVNEAIGKSGIEIFPIFDENTGEPIHNLMKRILNNKKIIELGNNNILVNRDGKKIPISDSAAPILNDKDEILGVVLVFHDETERRRTDRKLRESEEKYRSSIEAAPYGVVVYNIKDEVILSNKMLEEITGYDVNEIQSSDQWFKKLYPDNEYRKKVVKGYNEDISSDLPKRRETEIIRKNGEKRTCMFASSFISHELRIVFVSDVTEKVKADRALRVSEEWNKAIKEGSKDAIFIADVNSKFIDVNKAAVLLTGYSREELLNMFIPDLHEEEDMEAYNKFFNRIMSGESIVSESKILKKDGTKVDVEFSNKRIIINGKAYMHTIARDVTERKRAEAALRDSEERYRTLFNFGADAIFVHPYKDKGFGKFVEVNKVACDRLGYTREELLNLTPADISKKVDVKKRGSSRERGRILKNGSRSFEAVHITKDGREIPVEIISTVFQYGGEKVLMSVARDISEWKGIKD